MNVAGNIKFYISEKGIKQTTLSKKKRHCAAETQSDFKREAASYRFGLCSDLQGAYRSGGDIS